LDADGLAGGETIQRREKIVDGVASATGSVSMSAIALATGDALRRVSRRKDLLGSWQKPRLHCAFLLVTPV